MSVDLQRIFERARAVLTAPRATWRVVAQETETVAGLYQNYIVVLAAMPPLFSFIKGSVLGYGSLFGMSIRVGVQAGIGSMLVTFLLSLAAVYVFALLLEALAPSFDGRKDRLQALKLVAYSSTAAFVAGAAVIIPGIGSLVYLAGVIYTFYLLYLGVQHTLLVPAEKAATFTAIAAVTGIVIGILVTRLAAVFTGPVVPFGGYSFW